MRVGILFAASVILLGALAIVDHTMLGQSSRSGFDHGGSYANAERAVLARSVVMQPGDRLVVAANVGVGFPTFSKYDLLVVPGGDRFAILEGREPRAVYAAVRGMDTQSCCPQGDLVFVRPDDALAHRAPRIPEEGGTTPEEFLAMEQAALDQPDRVDLVWVFSYSERATRPSTPQEQQAVAQELERPPGLGLSPMLQPGYPTVFQAHVAASHAALTWAMAALAILAAASTLFWGIALRAGRVESEGTGAESLLRLYDAAGLWLAALRDLLLGSLLALLAVALHVALIGEPGISYVMADRAQMAQAPARALKLALMLAYSALVVAWAYAVWTAHRALRNWRARRAASPPELA